MGKLKLIQQHHGNRCLQQNSVCHFLTLSTDCLVEKAASLSSESRSVTLQLMQLSEVCFISANEGEINLQALSDGLPLKKETPTAWPCLTETHVNTLPSVLSSSSLSSSASSGSPGWLLLLFHHFLIFPPLLLSSPLLLPLPSSNFTSNFTFLHLHVLSILPLLLLWSCFCLMLTANK